jgi:hypothetical protein
MHPVNIINLSVSDLDLVIFCTNTSKKTATVDQENFTTTDKIQLKRSFLLSLPLLCHLSWNSYAQKYNQKQVLRIRDNHSESRARKIPGSASASKNLSILTQKIVSKLSEI